MNESAVESDEDRQIREAVFMKLEQFHKSDQNVIKAITIENCARAMRVLIHEEASRLGFASRSLLKNECDDDADVLDVRVFRKKNYSDRASVLSDDDHGLIGDCCENDDGSRYTENERGKATIEREFDLHRELNLQRNSANNIINCDLVRRKYHKLAMKIHPNERAKGKCQGWCDDCGMLLELNRWFRFAHAPPAPPLYEVKSEHWKKLMTMNDQRKMRAYKEDYEEMGRSIVDSCLVCFTQRKKRLGLLDCKEFDEQAGVVRIRDLNVFGNEKSESGVFGNLREMYCLRVDSDDDDDDDEQNKVCSKWVTRAHYATKKFKKLTIAYLCLKDKARAEIYKEHGWVGLKKHESLYAEEDIFECDPWKVYDDFFDGVCEEDRQYLLFNAGGDDDDDDDDDDDRMEEENEEEEESSEEDNNEDDEEEEELKLLKEAKEFSAAALKENKVMHQRHQKFPAINVGIPKHERFDVEEEDEQVEDIWQTSLAKLAK